MIDPKIPGCLSEDKPKFEKKTKKKVGYPLVNCQISIENHPVEIVDLPIENGDFP